MAQFGKIQIHNRDATAEGYRGEGIWGWCRESCSAFELPKGEGFMALTRRIAAEFDATLPELYDLYHLSDQKGTWEIFPEQGLFKVTTGTGRSWYAPYGLVASWNRETHSWLWGWGIPADHRVPPAVLTVPRRLRETGAIRGWRALTEPALLVNEHEAWLLTQLAADASDMPLVYRAQVNAVNVHFFAIGTPTWSS